MGQPGKKATKRRKTTAVKDLTVKEAKAVKGGERIAVQETHITKVHDY